MAKKAPPKNNEKRAAILKELESVRSLLNEDIGDSEESLEAPTENKSEQDEHQEEYQIPLLDPAKPGTYEIDFSKKAPPPPPEEPTTHEIDFSKKPEPAPEPVSKPAPPPPKKEVKPEDIPMVDDVKASSLFEDEEDTPEIEEPLVTQAELRDHAQLIIQDLLNDAISEIEEKLDDWIPKLEIKLQKRLEKAIDKYIEDAMKK